MTNHGTTLEPEETGSIDTANTDTIAIPTGKCTRLVLLTRRAFERIAEDAALTGELTDDVAQILLDWALNEIQRLVTETQEMEDQAAQAALAPKIHYLRRYLRTIARNAANEDNPTQALYTLLAPPTYPEP